MIRSNFKLVKGGIIHSFLHGMIPQAVDIVKEAYLAHDALKTVNPNSYFLRFPDKPSARIIALPAALNFGKKISGIKWISSYPENVQHGFQRASAVIILNDYETGYPIACLEGSVISAMRTACSAVLAAEYINSKSKNVGVLGLIGNGIISKYILSCFLKNGWHIGKIKLFDLDISSAHKLSEFIGCEYSGEIEILDSYEDLIHSSDMIVCTTTASVPYITNHDLLKHNPIILNISLRDIDADILLNSNNIVDDIDHVLVEKTSVELAFKKQNSKDFINGTIAELLLRKIKIHPNKPTIFSPMGMGILDLALANFIIHNLPSESSTNIEDFFSDISR